MSNTSKHHYKIAVIGATGSVGGQILSNLYERNFPVDEIFAIASDNSLGRSVSFGEKHIKVGRIEDVDFSKVDIAFFVAGSAVSRKYAEIATSAGCIVIDKSSHFRLNDKIPLIVPEVNEHIIQNNK
jgi:aspartate-semialdehyde dehydrogenase